MSNCNLLFTKFESDWEKKDANYVLFKCLQFLSLRDIYTNFRISCKSLNTKINSFIHERAILAIDSKKMNLMLKNIFSFSMPRTISLDDCQILRHRDIVKNLDDRDIICHDGGLLRTTGIILPKRIRYLQIGGSNCDCNRFNIHPMHNHEHDRDFLVSLLWGTTITHLDLFDNIYFDYADYFNGAYSVFNDETKNLYVSGKSINIITEMNFIHLKKILSLRNLKELGLSYVFFDKSLDSTEYFDSNIEKLSIYACDIKPKQLLQLVAPNLKTLEFLGSGLPPFKSFRQPATIYIAELIKGLKLLKMSGRCNISRLDISPYGDITLNICQDLNALKLTKLVLDKSNSNFANLLTAKGVKFSGL